MVDKAKIETVGELHEKFSRAVAAVLSDFRGMNVQEIDDLRGEHRQAVLEIRVVKNTLAKRAIQGTHFEKLAPYFEGPTSVTLSYEDPVVPAKVLSTYAKKQPKLQIKVACVEGQILDQAGLSTLADLPPREILLAHLLSVMQAPVSGFVGVLQGITRKFLGTLQAIEAQKKSQESTGG